MRVVHCLLPLLATLAQAGNIVEELTDLGTFSTLLNLAERAGQADTLATGGPFTLFAPTNKAFEEKMKNLEEVTNDEIKKMVLYHAVPGKIFSKDLQNDITVNSVEGFPIRINIYNKTVTINGVEVEKADIEASNGVIHVMEAAISPIPSSNIAQLVATDSRFSTLLAAVSAAGLAETLSGKGPFTVFAPTNEAFAKISNATLADLLANKPALTQVLLRHVVPGTIFSAGIEDNMQRFTAGGNTAQDAINFTVKETDEEDSSEESKESSSEEDKDDETIQVKTVAGTATVIDHDIVALNGVIHVIDTVI